MNHEYFHEYFASGRKDQQIIDGLRYQDFGSFVLWSSRRLNSPLIIYEPNITKIFENIQVTVGLNAANAVETLDFTKFQQEYKGGEVLEF